ncbi:unnamed protein product [Coffea canephora]|uniref:Zinc finger PHD-type domain-containing protein n=1 Tax=Coffea canephora TaxID=49390 RepID=A0A068UJC4_COFCA|nr:unnamed protein product [Coffea canephora]
MGKPGSQPQFDQSSTTPGTDQSSLASINHFSHPHPLQLSNCQSQQGFSANLCSGCKLEASGIVYSCTMCNYFLHQKCSQMPQKITHPFDQNNHVLSLLPKPAYPGGIFNCDACSQQGNGFCYHCQTCGIDLHILCASMPMAFTHQSHHHQLNLTFSPPYPNKAFSCDICKMNGHNHWLYHCSICQFDVHLTCVNALPINRTFTQPPSVLNQIQSMITRSVSMPPAQPTMPNNFANNVNPVGFNSFRPTGGMAAPIHLQSQPQSFVATPYAAPTPTQQTFIPPNNYMTHGGYGQPVMPAGYAQQQNNMTTQIVGGIANGLASGASQSATQALIQGIFGGGGGGNGGGGNDVTGFSTTGADVIPADQGTYFVSDGSFNQIDGGYGGDVTTTY